MGKVAAVIAIGLGACIAVFCQVYSILYGSQAAGIAAVPFALLTALGIVFFDKTAQMLSSLGSATGTAASAAGEGLMETGTAFRTRASNFVSALTTAQRISGDSDAFYG